VEIERKGRIQCIVADPPPRSRLSGMKKRDFIVGDPEDLVEIDWLSNGSRETGGGRQRQTDHQKSPQVGIRLTQVAPIASMRAWRKNIPEI
jgi:hypothetical protein